MKKPPGRGAEGRHSRDREKPSLSPTTDPRKQASTTLSTEGPWGVPARVWHRLITGEEVAPGWSGIRSLLIAFVAADVPDSSIFSVFLNPDNAGAEYIHTSSRGKLRPHTEAHGMVRRGIVSTRRWLLAHPNATSGDRYTAATYAIEVLEAAGMFPERWSGSAGATDLAVLHALVDIAVQAGKWEIAADVRTVADRAGVSAATAGRSLTRLRAGRPWIRREHPATAVRAAVYRLVAPPVVRSGGELGETFSPVVKGTTPCVSDSSPAADVWRWGGGLGKSAYRVWQALGVEPKPTALIASALLMSPRGVRKHLASLRRYGLAFDEAGGWVRGTSFPEDVGAALPVVAGRGEAQRERHRAQREGRAEYLAHKRALGIALQGPNGTTITVYRPPRGTAAG